MPEERTDEAYLQWKADNQKNENDYISSRWSQFYELEKEWGQTAIKYLVMFNAGGAIATLSFVGALGASQIGNTAIIALSLFVAGVVIAGFMVAHAYKTCSSLFKHFRLDEAKHSRGDLSYEDFLSADEARVPSGKLETALGYLSFACFIVGCVIGAVGLFNPSISKDAPVEHASQSASASTNSTKLVEIEP